MPKTQYKQVRREEPSLQDREANALYTVKRVGTTTAAMTTKRRDPEPESSIK